MTKGETTGNSYRIKFACGINIFTSTSNLMQVTRTVTSSDLKSFVRLETDVNLSELMSLLTQRIIDTHPLYTFLTYSNTQNMFWKLELKRIKLVW